MIRSKNVCILLIELLQWAIAMGAMTKHAIATACSDEGRVRRTGTFFDDDDSRSNCNICHICRSAAAVAIVEAPSFLSLRHHTFWSKFSSNNNNNNELQLNADNNTNNCNFSSSRNANNNNNKNKKIKNHIFPLASIRMPMFHTHINCNNNNNSNNNTVTKLPWPKNKTQEEDYANRLHTIQQIKKKLSEHQICCENVSTAVAKMAPYTTNISNATNNNTSVHHCTMAKKRLSRTYTRDTLFLNNVVVSTVHKKNI